MITLKRTNAKDPDFIALVAQLDAHLKMVDGDDNAFYSQYNKIDQIKYAIIAYQDDNPVGCGAIKQHGPKTMEVKRMYVLPSEQGKGIASKVLAALENWAIDLKNSFCILETGHRQTAAVALYTKSGYQIIANYGQYQGVENSICFQKALNLPVV